MSDMKQFPWNVTPWNFAAMKYSYSISGLFTFYVVQPTSLGNMKFSTSRMNKYMYNCLYCLFTCVFFCTVKNTLMTLGKVYKK